MSRPSAPVTRLRAADAEELLGMVEELTRRVDYLTRVAEQHEKYADRLDEHAEALDAHEDRLNAVDEALAPKPKEPSLTERVEAFVNANPGIKFTGMIVAESMGLPDYADYNRINSSLATLSGKGRIAVDIREGRTRVYYANPAPAAPGGAS